MELGELITIYRKQANLTIDELSEKANVPKGTLNKIIAGTTKAPTLDNIKALARALGRTLDDFDDTHKEGNKKSALSDDRTLEFATKFFKLDKHGREIVEFVINNESERMKNEAEDVTDIISATLPMWTINDLETITLPLLLQSRSAGNGDFADDESAEDKAAYLSDITRRADYLIKVNGESMEPDYPDGCIVAVRLQEDVKLGEVGVFVSSGDSYIKRRGVDSLESINTEYPDVIPMNGTVCRGLVLGVVE